MNNIDIDIRNDTSYDITSNICYNKLFSSILSSNLANLPLCLLSDDNDIIKYNDKYILPVIRSDFCDVKEIGDGSFGNVILCEYNNKNISSKINYALKIIDKSTPEFKRDVHVEIYLQTILNHDKIVKCYGWFEDSDKYYTVLDYIEGPDLFDRINLLNLPQNIIHNYLLQLSDILAYLKINNIIHRDIKPENILVDKNDNIYLCDFGLAWIGNSKCAIEKITDRIVGTIEYMTPECITCCEYSFSTDLWAFGVIAYEMYYDNRPFQNQTAINTDQTVINQEEEDQHTLKNIISLNVHYDDNSESLKILNSMLRKIFTTYTERITIEECKNHEFLIMKD